MPVTINGTTGVVGPDGSASTPSYQGSDSNTGMFFPAADTIAFAEGGTEVMRIDSSGNLGIGTTAPGQRLEVANSSTNTTFSTVGNQLLIRNSGSTVNAFARMDFALGASNSPTASIAATVSNYGTGATDLLFGTFNTGGGVVAERARIDSSGNLLVGTTSNGLNVRLNVIAQNSSNPAALGAQVGINGAYAYAVQNASGTNVGGVIANASTTSYATSSDYRLKEEVQPMMAALSKVAELKPCTYKWKATGQAGEGFIAHELQAVVPDCVTGEKDAVETYTDEDGVEQTRPVYQGIDTSFLVATLTAAIQELTARVQALEAK